MQTTHSYLQSTNYANKRKDIRVISLQSGKYALVISKFQQHGACAEKECKQVALWAVCKRKCKPYV